MNPYQTLAEKLEALTDKRLARCNLWVYELKCGCAIGQVLPHEVRRGAQSAIDLPECSWRTVAIGTYLSGLGFTTDFVQTIQQVNDDPTYRDQTTAERYARVLRYLKEKANEASQ